MHTAQNADMHCHLGFCSTAPLIARAAEQAGMLLFNNTTTPAEYEHQLRETNEFANVTVGFGMHPWWVQEEAATQKIVELLEEHEPFALGEIGLDFGPRHISAREAQLATFEAILQWAAKTGNHLLSIHAVHASSEALEALERTGALTNNTCIFHWFSGSQPELTRALNGGCYFSVGQRMLATKKGRAYVNMLPTDRLLLETDQPQPDEENFTFAQLQQSLQTAADKLCAIKGPDCIDIINATSDKLLKPFAP